MVEARRLIREGRAVESDGKFTLTEGIEMAKKQTRFSVSLSASVSIPLRAVAGSERGAVTRFVEDAICARLATIPGPTAGHPTGQPGAEKARFGSAPTVTLTSEAPDGKPIRPVTFKVAKTPTPIPDPRKVPSVPIRIEVRPDAPSPLAARRSPLAAKPVATAAATDRARRWNDQIPTAKRSPVASLAKPTGRKAAEVRDAKRAEPVDRPTKPPVPVVDMERGRVQTRRVEAVRPAALDVRDPRTVRF